MLSHKHPCSVFSKHRISFYTYLYIKITRGTTYNRFTTTNNPELLTIFNTCWYMYSQSFFLFYYTFTMTCAAFFAWYFSLTLTIFTCVLLFYSTQYSSLYLCCITMSITMCTFFKISTFSPFTCMTCCMPIVFYGLINT